MLPILLAVPAWATVTIDDCTSADGPNEYWSNFCDGACTYDNATDTLTCDLSNVDPDLAVTRAWAVTTFGSSTSDYSVFGIVDNTRFCCAIDEDATDRILKLELVGTESCDELRLSWDDGSGGNPEENLEPASGQNLEGIVYARGGSLAYNKACEDTIYGSDYRGADYRDKLFGEDGPDHIYGLGDRDFIDGGHGDDVIEGNLGNDVIVGGCGADTLMGLAGNDTICDTNGSIVNNCGCNSDGDDLMDGGDGKDILWYEKSAVCLAGALDSTSTCGGHPEDVFGNSNHWSTPVGCIVPTNIPVDCSFP